jgi:CBS domain-containing protein
LGVTERRTHVKVQEIMTRDVLTIGPEADIRDVARIFVERGISGLPVCDAQRELLGVVSEGDILFKERGPVDERHLASRRRRAAAKDAMKARAITVQEAMSAPAITVAPYNSVAEAARLMSEHGINRLPVLRNDELVGIVTRTDLVRAFVRSDEDIRREIEEDVLLRTLWLEAPESIGLEIERGAVQLSGHMELCSEAILLERLVSSVPGVVSVRSTVSWTTDDATRKAKRELRRTHAPVSRG